MAVAMISPDPKQLKRKQKPINGDHGVASQRIADARAVLKYSRELAEAVMRGEKPLQAALAEARLSQGSVRNDRARLAKLRDEPPVPEGARLDAGWFIFLVPYREFDE